MNVHEETNGYRFLGVNKSGVWGMHSLADVVISEQERLERKIARQKAEKERLEALRKESLPVKERDKAIRTIHRTLGLTRADKAKLMKRGLSESQVDSFLSFSVRGKTQLPDNIPSNLAGVRLDRSGKKYLYCDDGFACPSFDFDGNVIGWQYRSNLTNSGNKYIWAKGLKSSHLPNGELPITFVRGEKPEAVNQWLEEKEVAKGLKPIFALEGLLKPYVASCRFGVDVIGASGFNFSTSKEQTTEIINRGGYNCVIFPLDGGAVLNPMVMSHLRKNIKLFESLGCQILIGWWSQIEKTDQDFDEIESLEKVKLIDYETLKTISSKAIFRQWKKDELNKLRGFKADKVIYKPRFYDEGQTSDAEIDFILDNNQVVIIQGSKATGKSYMIKHKIKRWRSQGFRIINIGCRRVLSEAQSNEWGLTYLMDAENEQYSLFTIFERDGGLSAVVDSLLKLKNIDWGKTIIIIDEFEQFVNHLLTANTQVKDYRGYILQCLEDCFRHSISTGGKIIALDADASDLSSDWLKGITQVKPFKLQNTAKAHNNNCYLYSGDKDGYNDLIQSILNDLSQEEEIFLASDSRKDLEAILEIVKTEFPKLSSEIVTSDTVAEKYIRGFIKSPNEAIEQSNVAFLGVSPVAQSGISIDIKNYFAKVYGICSGIIEPSTMRQLLARVRDNCDRYLWIADRARGVYSNDFDYQKILEERETFIQSLPEIAQYVTALHQNLTNAELLEKIKELLDKQDNLTDINSVTKAKLTARRNLVLSNYRAVLIEELQAEGYQIHNHSSDHKTVYDCDVSVTKEDLDMNQATAIFKADDIDHMEQQRLKNKPYPTKDEQNQLRKYAIRDNFPLITLNPLFILNFIIKDNWVTLKAVKRFWFTQNKEVAKNLDTRSIHHQNKVALTGGKLWLDDIKPNMQYVALFERLGLSEFVNDDLVFHKQSEEIKTFFERCKDYRKVDGISNRQLLRNCGIKFSNNAEPVNLLRKVINLFGFKLEFMGQSRKLRTYRVTKAVDDILWQELMDGFSFKYQQIDPIEFDFNLENNDNYDYESCENVSFSTKIPRTNDEHSFEGDTLTPSVVRNNNPSVSVSTQDTISDSTHLGKKVNFEPKLSLNNRELIGVKANFWNNNNQWVTGFITELFDFGIQLKDEKGDFSYCNINQIELLR